PGGLEVGLDRHDGDGHDRTGAGRAAEGPRVADVEVGGIGAALEVAVTARGGDVVSPALQVEPGAVVGEVEPVVGGAAPGADQDRPGVLHGRVEPADAVAGVHRVVGVGVAVAAGRDHDDTHPGQHLDRVEYRRDPLQRRVPAAAERAGGLLPQQHHVPGLQTAAGGQ